MKNIITVALGVVLGLVVLSALPGFSYYAAYVVGQLWFSGAGAVIGVIGALIAILLWRDREQVKQRRLKAEMARLQAAQAFMKTVTANTITADSIVVNKVSADAIVSGKIASN